MEFKKRKIENDVKDTDDKVDNDDGKDLLILQLRKKLQELEQIIIEKEVNYSRRTLLQLKLVVMIKIDFMY